MEDAPKEVNFSLLSQEEPSSFKEARDKIYWVKAMNEELDKIKKNQTRELVPRPNDKNIIGTKWVFKKNLNEHRKVTRNKVRLVCKGYAQFEGIYFE